MQTKKISNALVNSLFGTIVTSVPAAYGALLQVTLDHDTNDGHDLRMYVPCSHTQADYNCPVAPYARSKIFHIFPRHLGYGLDDAEFESRGR